MKRITKRLSVAGTRLSLLLLLMALLPNMASAQCPDNNHPHMIDLGLPSGTKWACCNVGATTPEGYGDYFAWGETQPKEVYNWDTYQYGSSWNNVVSIGSDIAGTSYDAATVNWGAPWQMPTLDLYKELYDNCTSEWTTLNGVNGRMFTGLNRGTIFFPAAGHHLDSNLYVEGSNGAYWSSSLTELQGLAYKWNVSSESASWSEEHRSLGISVRPVAAPSSDIPINETNFPDANFRNWVLSQTYGQDGVLTAAEIAGVTSMDFSMQNIANLKGIEYFTALTKLECSNNQLTSLDVSHNTALTYLSCYMNQLTSLDVSHNTALTTLWCGNNPLTSLDISHNTALTSLECGYNQLTSLDVSHNTTLTSLECSNNQLTSLDVSHNTALTSLGCVRNQLTSLDVSHNTALTSLSCEYNQLISLDVSHNTALTSLGCSGNQLISLDVSHNTALTSLSCYDNQLTSLDVSKNTALTSLGCYVNHINETNMGNLVEGLPTVNGGGSFYVKQLENANEYNVITTAQVAAAKAKGWTVYAYDANTWNWVEYEGDATTSIPINETNFPDANFRNWVLSQTYGQDGVLTAAEIAGVTSMDFSMQNIANLKGIEYFTALKELRCYSNQLTSLDVSHNTALTELGCSDNQLTSLDISQNTALGYLDCCYNQLTSLDVSKNTALTILYCSGNQLTSLDVSHNMALTILNCYDNQLNALDVLHNTALNALACGGNQLTSLDVSHSTALKGLDCSGNHLTSLDVSQNSALADLHCYNNHINETEMGNLVESLPTVTTVSRGEGFYVKHLDDANEQNVITKAQVAVAKAKGWTVYAFDANWNSVEYDGDEPTLNPITTETTVNTNNLNGQDLSDNVVDDVYYNVGNDGYDATDGSIVINSTTDMGLITDATPGSADVVNNFAGLIMKVAAGKGTITVNVKTTGNAQLAVQIGNQTPTIATRTEKGDVVVSYDVAEDTYVYIYAVVGSSPAPARLAPADGDVRIYSIKVAPGTTGISSIDNGELTIDNYYTLDGRMLQGKPTQKGIYIINGHKVVIK